MALAIKVLGFGQLTTTSIVDLLVVSPVPTGKAQIVKTMRFATQRKNMALTIKSLGNGQLGNTPVAPIARDQPGCSSRKLEPKVKSSRARVGVRHTDILHDCGFAR